MKILKRITVTDDDGLLVRYVIKHYKYLVMLFVLIIIYISTGLIYDLQIREQNRLENTLLRVRTKYNMQLLEYREFSNYQNLIRQLERHNLDLEEPATPPLKVKK